MSVEGKTIVLGVCGGIAAYKAATICSQLKQKGANIRVIMTTSATQFIQPLTFQTLSRHHVYLDTFAEYRPEVVSHIDVADQADLFLIAPATANMIGKLANGIADDMMSTTLLATEAPVWMAPAMNGHMLAHPTVQANLEVLTNRGVKLLAPGEGLLACGYVGKGRMAEPEQMIEEVVRYFAQQENSQSPEELVPLSLNPTEAWWKGKKVVITAGPTREEIDPVRYLTNHSSGKMGYALAEVAAQLGAEVTLVSGPVSIEAPHQVKVIKVQSTAEMLHEVLSLYNQADVVIKAAAVADYQPVHVENVKIKKSEDTLMLKLKKTTDILHTLGQKKKHQILVGFAAETNDVEHHAVQKMKKKNLDFIVANDVTAEGAGFGTDTNLVTIYQPNGKKVSLPLLSKKEVARRILGSVAEPYA